MQAGSMNVDAEHQPVLIHEQMVLTSYRAFRPVLNPVPKAISRQQECWSSADG